MRRRGSARTPVIVYCPRCGLPLPVQVLGSYIRTSDLCRDCGLALAEVPGMLAPSDDEVAYGLDEWPASDRATLTGGLLQLAIPYRWEDNLVLAVPLTAESTVDQMLDDIERNPVTGNGAGGDAVAVDTVDGGPDAQDAMAELFVAADRLHHLPFDRHVVDEFTVHAVAVQDSLPPYGIERSLWRRVQDLARDTMAATQAAYNDEMIAARAGELRDLLRTLV